MNPTDAMRWILCLCQPFLRLSHAKTLRDLVVAGLTLDRASFAELGRRLARGTPETAKSGIKRVDRFVGNSLIEPTEAMRPLIQWLAEPGKPLLVSVDWVELRRFHCLVLAVHFSGRALPLLWAVYRTEDLYRSQNYLEYGLLRVFRTMVPETTPVTLLADRGFGRAEMARTCQQLGFSYILRIKPDVYVACRAFTGRLSDLPIQRGQERMLREVVYRKDGRVCHHLAVVWPDDQNAPWFLATNLPRIQARRLTRIFGHRMTIEEYFRDLKSKRNGFAQRLSLIRDPRRLERWLLILAWIYWVLVAVGLQASKRFSPKHWSSNSRGRECSFFTIGRFMLDRIRTRLKQLMSNLRKNVLAQKWG